MIATNNEDGNDAQPKDILSTPFFTAHLTESNSDVVAKHKYRWTMREILTVVICAGIAIALVVLGYTTGMPLDLSYAIGGLFALAAIWGVWVGGSRKKKSELTATLINGVLEVRAKGGSVVGISESQMHKNSVSLGQVSSINYTENQDAIILRSEGQQEPNAEEGATEEDNKPVPTESQACFIPTRLLSDPAMVGLLTSLLSQNHKNITIHQSAKARLEDAGIAALWS